MPHVNRRMQLPCNSTNTSLVENQQDEQRSGDVVDTDYERAHEEDKRQTDGQDASNSPQFTEEIGDA